MCHNDIIPKRNPQYLTIKEQNFILYNHKCTCVYMCMYMCLNSTHSLTLHSVQKVTTTHESESLSYSDRSIEDADRGRFVWLLNFIGANSKIILP